jgi:pimeloyl-ACP methyl ester carboxylesterase
LIGEQLVNFYDPAPTLQRLQTPTLALFGELDNNFLAEKNKSDWEAALKAGGNRDYTLRILPKANHLQLEAKVGTNAEMAPDRPDRIECVPLFFLSLRLCGSNRLPSSLSAVHE